ncbi:MAG: DNA alkylation repair protein, partial [Myxococcota bacterium]
MKPRRLTFLAAGLPAHAAGAQRVARRFLDDVRAAFAAAAVAADAAPMQAYMRSAMPFHGVKKPARMAALKPLWASHRCLDWRALETVVRESWDGATHREERYAVLDLLEWPAHRRLQSPEALPCFEHLIVSGAWWDFVDDVAGKKVCRVWLGAPEATAPTLRRWMRAEDRWLRRSAILAQLRAKERTDPALLTASIEAAMHDQDFFLRKAIGWALRQRRRRVGGRPSRRRRDPHRRPRPRAGSPRRAAANALGTGAHARAGRRDGAAPGVAAAAREGPR